TSGCPRTPVTASDRPARNGPIDLHFISPKNFWSNFGAASGKAAPARTIRAKPATRMSSRGSRSFFTVLSPNGKRIYYELWSISAAPTHRGGLVARNRVRRGRRRNHRSPQGFSRPIKSEPGSDDNPAKCHTIDPENCFTSAFHHGQAHQQQRKNSNQDRACQPTGYPEPALQFWLANSQNDQRHELQHQAGSVQHDVQRHKLLES